MRALMIAAMVAALSSPAWAQEPATQKPFEPVSGQAGKDVVWVPSPPDMVNKLMEMAKVTPSDFVIDLGSGDGRNIIAAAKLGARALGVEYNPDMNVRASNSTTVASTRGRQQTGPIKSRRVRRRIAGSTSANASIR